MEIMVFFSLMLLVCSVSTNQTEADNEIVDQQISNQQPCPQDIHAVLREMAVSLAEQKVEIRTLKQENQDHITKLKELESHKNEIDWLKQKSKEQEAKLETEIDQLKQEQQVKQVAFSVSLLEQGSRDIGPFNIHMTLIFKRVVTNIGNAYNKHTGIFTAPVRGVYHFDWSIYGHGNIQTGAPLFRNGEHIFAAYEHPASGGVSASNGASLLLEVGDQVSVRLWANTRIYDNQNHHNTFSGHLIFTM
ncbi:complement C1q tumor necrosis factor-related protein 3 isoform X1 [Oreochromis niloticus]|uniref:Complement C1q tumor necrosis factor-related protein 3 n=1 Tax=Oreochromis niloticus TaxID=8128 RepID=A0A669EUY3_ORENI|nr:complement C1q tumor necrosis factor-related protein 3 isoform X1 [Oreochromis niloticus]